MTIYAFTRRAKDAAWSDRTCKLGTLDGTFKEALQKARALCLKEGTEITVKDDGSGVVVLVLRHGGNSMTSALLMPHEFDQLIA